jgi:hypothetical protein
MTTNQTENDRREKRPGETDGTWCCAGATDLPGSFGDMREMMKTGPCGGFLTRHRLAVYTALTVAGLGILVIQAGFVLGIIAFFRTF